MNHVYALAAGFAGAFLALDCAVEVLSYRLLKLLRLLRQ